MTRREALELSLKVWNILAERNPTNGKQYLIENFPDLWNQLERHLFNCPLCTLYYKGDRDICNLECPLTTCARYSVYELWRGTLCFNGKEHTGVLEFPITGQAYDDIMAIRQGEVPLEEFYKICDKYEEENRKARELTTLPEAPDWKWANRYLVDTLENYIVKNSRIK